MRPETAPGDLRLLGPAVALWIGAWSAPLLGGLPSVLVAAGGGLMLVVVVLRRRTQRGRRRIARSVAILVAGAVVSLFSVGVRLLALQAASAPIADAASTGLRGVVTSDPVVRGSTAWVGAPDTVSVTVRLSTTVQTGNRVRVRAPVLVLATGPGWAGIRPGQVVQFRGSARSPPTGSQLAAIVFGRGPVTVVAPAPAWQRVADRLRSGLRAAAAGRSPDVAGLLPALVVGDTSALAPDLADDMREAGLTHLTAVSGANLSIVLVAVLLAARLLGLRGRALLVLGAAVVVGFVVVARPQPSVLRAAVMGTLGAFALTASGRRRGIRMLLAAVVVLLLLDPWLARSWGFALSVAATAGLLVVARRWAAGLGRVLPSLFADALAVSVAAQAATLPLQVALAGSAGWLAVPANLLAAPAVAPATVLGAAAAAVSPISSTGAALFAWLAGWPVAWIAGVARWASGVGLPRVDWPTGTAGLAVGVALVAVIGGVGVLTGRVLRGRGPAVRLVAVLLAVVLVVAWWRGPGRWPPSGWVLVMCDVGQGDALVIATGASSAVVVDTGREPGAVDRCLRRLGVRYVAALVLTHDDADHVNGLAGVLRNRTVGGVYVSPLDEPAEQAMQVRAAAADARVPVQSLTAGQRASVGPVTWDVVWPARIIRGEGSDSNNASVVLLVQVNGVRMVLSGDVEPAAQRAILQEHPDLRADVLKVPHHGSASQDPAFWAATDARIALVSVGEDNPYGHPDPGLLSRLSAAGMLVRRTDQDGDVAVVVDDGTLRVVNR